MKHQIYWLIRDQKTLIKECDSPIEAMQIATAHQKAKSTIESFYNRMWIDPASKELYIDYGAHNAFFVITNIDNLDQLHEGDAYE